MAYKLEPETFTPGDSPACEFAPRFTSINDQEEVASRTLFALDIGSVADARFLQSGSSTTLAFYGRSLFSAQTGHLFEVIRAALEERGIPGSETARREIHFVSQADGEVRLKLVLFALEKATPEDQRERDLMVSEVVAPLIEDLMGGHNQLDLVRERGKEVYSPVMQEQVTAFQCKYSGKKAAERIDVSVGETTCASIAGGRWPHVEQPELPDQYLDVTATCNGWMSDRRLVSLHVLDDKGQILKKIEALFDQYRDEDLIRDAAGRKDRLLDVRLRVENRSNSEKMHIESMALKN